MDRLACISIPHLALQIALRRYPPKAQEPVVLVRDDRPASPILQLNRAAARQGLHPGMRYSEALSIFCDLNAEVVASHEILAAVQEIRGTLTRWSPQIEACPFDQGSFWLNASGLTGLFGSEVQWGIAVREALAQKGYKAIVVIGFSREGTYILARSRRRSTLIRSQDAEKQASATAPLSVLPCSPRTRRLLEQLGITTLAELAAIPAQEILKRFGPEILGELRQMQALKALPLQPAEPPRESTLIRQLEIAVSDRQALLPILDELLTEALALLVRKARLLAELQMVFILENHGLQSEILRPAEPTTNLRILLRLIDLRLSHCEFPTGVTEIRLAFQEARLPPHSGELFTPPVVRDLRRGAQAITLIRAKLGNQAVVRAVIHDSHIPEQSFRWEEIEHLIPPVLKKTSTPQAAVRRIFLEPNPRELTAGQRLGGPFLLRVSCLGTTEMVDKEYWFLRNRRQEVQWVSRDRLSGMACLEGIVD